MNFTPIGKKNLKPRAPPVLTTVEKLKTQLSLLCGLIRRENAGLTQLFIVYGKQKKLKTELVKHADMTIII